jgi:putative restriction endonuclease
MTEEVTSVDEMVSNILTLDRYKLGSSSERILYAHCMRNPRHFVVLETYGEYIFAPGNFVIYRGNDSNKKMGIGIRSGGEPRRILGKIVGAPLEIGSAVYRELEERFMASCRRSGIEPSAHNRHRTYWHIGRDDSPENQKADDIRKIEGDPKLSPTERDELIKARRGQGKFRADLRARWKGACAVTGCTQNEILRASHIKPWRESTNRERRSQHNGILLCANLDALFDEHLISFEDDGEMIVSPRIASEDRLVLGLPRKLRLPLSAKEKCFLDCHRSAARDAGKL